MIRAIPCKFQRSAPPAPQIHAGRQLRPCGLPAFSTQIRTGATHTDSPYGRARSGYFSTQGAGPPVQPRSFNAARRARADSRTGSTGSTGPADGFNAARRARADSLEPLTLSRAEAGAFQRSAPRTRGFTTRPTTTPSPPVRRVSTQRAAHARIHRAAAVAGIQVIGVVSTQRAAHARIHRREDRWVLEGARVSTQRAAHARIHTCTGSTMQRSRRSVSTQRAAHARIHSTVPSPLTKSSDGFNAARCARADSLPKAFASSSTW